jgi:hypothetical protein
MSRRRNESQKRKRNANRRATTTTAEWRNAKTVRGDLATAKDDAARQINCVVVHVVKVQEARVAKVADRVKKVVQKRVADRRAMHAQKANAETVFAAKHAALEIATKHGAARQKVAVQEWPATVVVRRLSIVANAVAHRRWHATGTPAIVAG